MSTMVNQATMTMQERAAAATRDLFHTLDLGAAKPASVRLMSVALAEVAAAEARSNESFASKLRELYASLVPPKPEPKKTAGKGTRGGSSGVTKKKESEKLIPVGVVGEAELNPYGPPNPWALRRLYGDNQLKAALKRYSPERLKEAVALVQQKYPGTKPTSNRGMAPLIAYIFDQVTAEN